MPDSLHPAPDPIPVLSSPPIPISAHGQQTELLTADELARLRELACTPKKSWWNDYGLLVAGAGFALSLATGIISAYVGYRKDVHDQQAQLAAVLQTIPELTIRQAEVYEKYKGSSFENAATLLTAELNSNMRTATELALSLGPNATTAELTTIAQGQYAVGDTATTERLLEDGLDAAKNANDESIALRYLGLVKIRSGTTPEVRKQGEKLFQRARALDSKYDLAAFPYAVHFLRASAGFDWANAIAPLDCASAQTHFAEGIVDLTANPRSPEMEQMRRTALRAYGEGIGAVAGCRPSPETVLSP